MSFWKLFGKRTAPTETAVKEPQPPARVGVATRKVKGEPPSATRELEVVEENPDRSPAARGGFDPYNSGAFDRRGNWDKTRLK